jgi:hypothetical protein
MSTQNLTSLTHWFAQCAPSLVVSLAGFGALWLWLVKRFETVLDTYGQEQTKLAVQFSNVERLVEHTRQLTLTAETIKTELSQEAWSKQQLWLKRFEAYMTVSEELDRHRSAVAGLGNALKVRTEFTRANETTLKQIASMYEVAVEAYNKSCASWVHAKAVAHLCCGEDAIGIVNRIVFPILDAEVTVQNLMERHTVLSKASIDFVIAARNHLGYEAVSP